MPITDLQKTLVTQTIDYFFYDLPTEEKKLLEEIKKIEKAFKRELTEFDEKGNEEVYYTLQQCVSKPCNYFQNLRSNYFDYSSSSSSDLFEYKLTIGDVQTCLLDFASDRLESAAKLAKINSKVLGWDKEKIQDFLTKNHQFYLPYTPNIDYIYRNHFGETNRFASVNESQSNHPSSTINSLLDQQIITSSQLSSFSSDFNKILDHPFYYQKLINKQISINDLIAFNTQEQIRTLLSPKIIRLFGLGIITLSEIKAISTEFRNFIELDDFYYDLLEYKKINFSQVNKLTPRQYEILMTKEMICLIGKDVISITKALTLISNPLILSLLDKNILHTNDISKILPSLSSAVPIISEANNETISLEARTLLKAFMHFASMGLLFENDLLFLFNRINEFNYVYLRDSKDEKVDPIVLLKNNPFMQGFFKTNLTLRLNLLTGKKAIRLHQGETDNLEDIIKCSKEVGTSSIEVWTIIFHLQLQSIYNGNSTYKLEDVKKEMRERLANNFSLTPDQFNNSIKKHLANSIFRDLDDKCRKYPSEFKHFHEKVTNEIKKGVTLDLEQKDVQNLRHWDQILDSVEKLTKQTLADLSQSSRKRLKPNHKFFTRKSHLLDFCDNIDTFMGKLYGFQSECAVAELKESPKISTRKRKFAD